MITNFKRNNYVRDSVFCSSDMLKELAPNFECAQLKYGAIFLLHKVRENGHFLDHPPTTVPLRNLKMVPKLLVQLHKN